MKPSYEELKKELENCRREKERLESMVNQNETDSPGLSSADSLRKIYDICKSMVGATCGYVALKNEDGSLNEVLFLDDGGLPCSVDPNLPMPIRGLRADAYQLGEAVFENDFMNSDWIQFMPPGHVELKNVMFSPLNIKGETVGIIGLANKPTHFTEQDRNTAKAFGDVAGLELERSRIYQHLIGSEERFKLAMEATRDGLFDYNLITEKIYYSPAWKKMLGYSPEEIQNEAYEWERHTHPDDVIKTNQIIDRTINEKRRSFTAEFRMKHKSGVWVNILSTAKVIYNADGNAIRVIGTHKNVTKLKEADIKISQYTKRLETIFNASQDLLIIVDKDVRVLMINKKGASFIDKDRDVISGQLCGDVFECQHSFYGNGCGSNQECTGCPLRIKVLSTFESGQPCIEEDAQMTFKLNGAETVSDFSISTELLESDNEQNVLLSMTDITQRKKNEYKLIRQRQEIESVFRSAPVGIGVVIDRVITKANEKVENITGYSANELIGKNARILYPSNEDYEYVGTEKYRQISIYGTGTVETKWKRKDGTIVDILMSSTPIDLKDYSKGVTFSALDITESKQNEKALVESEAKYRTMMEVQEDPTYICSKDMRVEYMNPAMIKWAGKEAIGDKCYQVIWGRQSKCTWCVLDAVMNGETATTEVRVPDSEEMYHVSSAPIHHADNSISKFSSYRNVTDIRQLSIRLQQAQKMEAIGNLAGGIAHDFNNILFPIVGMSEMLIEDFPPNSIEHQNAQEIYKAGIRGSELVNQILAFSRQHEDKLSPTRLQFVMKEVFKLTRASIPSNIEINHSFQRDCGLVLADSTQLHQIGMNLITNAYHAVQEKGGKIDVDVREVQVNGGLNDLDLPPGRYATLTVADNGVGIRQEQIGKVFEPYFTTKEKGKGTGLGLSVVYGIIKKYKGDIKVVSKYGRGTSFQVYIPILDSSATETANYSTLSQPKGNEKILLVDDEAPIVNLQKQMLEKLGYSVSGRTSSLDALKTFKTQPDAYDLVISDMSMPQMPGDQLSAEILKIRPGTPIIICTGFSERIDKEQALEMGIKGFLLKPVVKAELVKEVRRVLDGYTDPS